MSHSYLILGVDREGRRRELARTFSALSARNLRDADNPVWQKIVVYGPDGELSRLTLNKLAAVEEDDD